MVDKKVAFRDAIKTGEIINVIYSGGSQPGAKRGIQPRKVDGNHLWALTYLLIRLSSLVLIKSKY